MSTLLVTRDLDVCRCLAAGIAAGGAVVALLRGSIADKHRKTRRSRHHSQAISIGRTLLLAVSVYAARFADYDFVVVGAGTAGSIASGELARREGYKILLIEAGADNFDPSITNLSGYFDVAFNTLNSGFLQWGLQTTPQELGGGRQGGRTSRNWSARGQMPRWIAFHQRVCLCTGAQFRL